MKIDEIGNEANPLTSPQRQREVRRLAQSMAAERFASGLAVNNTRAANTTPTLDRQDDTSELSTEAIDGISSKGGLTGINRTDQIISALKQSMEGLTQEPTRRNRGSESTRSR